MTQPQAAAAAAAGAPRAQAALRHRRTWGAEPLGGGRWRFALWAPEAGEAALRLGGRDHAMERGGDGFWRAEAGARAGDAYAFVVDGRATPDPMARAQASLDLWGPSVLVDPGAHRWAADWRGRPWEEAVVYELHLGTFTPEGTFAAAARRLPALAELGVTAIEVMPVAHGPGRRGWGYDGALLFAPHPAYGSPEEMRAFVAAAQGCGLSVILDVVMNHFSPEGSDMHRIAPGFFAEGRDTPWGAAIDFARPAVRAFFKDLCLGWLADYRLDGIRFDAVHQILDDTDPHFMLELGRAIRAEDWGRPIHLILEDERNLPHFRDTGLYDAQWNDDFHHALHVRLTGETQKHLLRYAADPVGDLARVLAEGQCETGQPREGLDEPRGAPAGHLPWTAFVNCNQNHDQVGNHPRNARLIALAPEARAAEVAHALLLGAPFVPMLWMGEEVGSREPFFYFTDVSEALARAISEGRRREFGLKEGESYPEPNDPDTFERSRPFRDEDGDQARHWRELTRRLLQLRRERIVPLLRSGRAHPARVERRGEGSLSAAWPFRAGTLRIHVNLGAPPDDPPPLEGPVDLALGDLAGDAWAIAIVVEHA
jgi:malto-oligosyltrehalose trehalohydrolase